MSSPRIPRIAPGSTALPDAITIKAGQVITEASKRFISDELLGKLNGIATGATKNKTDTELLARGNHTGTQKSSTIEDLEAAVRNVVGNQVRGVPAEAVYVDPITKEITITAVLGEGGTPAPTPEETGFIRADRSDFGLVPWNPLKPVYNNFTKVYNALRGTGKYLRIDHVYAMDTTDPEGTNFFKNQDMLIFGRGTILTQGPVPLRFMADFSPEIAQTNIGTMQIGDSSDRRSVTFANVAQSDLQKFGAGFAWQFCAKPVKGNTSNVGGFYPWSLPGTEPNDLTGTNIMAEAMIVGGLTFLVNTDADRWFGENQVLEGVTSKAKMRVTSAETDNNGSTLKRITTERISGTFAVNEDLRVTEDWTYPATQTRAAGKFAVGTVIGSIAANGVVYFATTTEADFGALTCPVILRKCGGSRKGYSNGDYFSNLLVDVSGINVDTTTGDVHSRVASHAGAFWIGNAVNYRFTDVKIRGAFRNGFYMASVVNGFISGATIDSLPNNAERKTDGYSFAFGYGVEYIGACAGNIVTGCRISSTRHGISQNSSANSEFQLALEDNLLHGTQKDLITTNTVVSNNISAAFDTHFGAIRTAFYNCTAIGSNRGMGWKDSGGALFTNRSHTTSYYNCNSIGGWCGFSNVATGYTTGEDSSAFYDRVLYQDCSARKYMQYGFRNGLRSEGANHQLVYRRCFAEDRNVPYSSSSITGANAPYGTAGFQITATNAILEDCVAGSNSIAGVLIEPGRWDAETSSTPNPVPTITIAIVGGLTVDFSNSVHTTAVPIAVTGTATAGQMRLSIAGDISVLEKSSAPVTAAVYGVEDNFDLLVGASVKNILGTRVIPLYKSDGATANIKLMPGASAPIHYGSARPSTSFEGLVWMEPSGAAAVYDGDNWMMNGTQKALALSTDPDILAYWDANSLDSGSVASWPSSAGAWEGSLAQATAARQPTVVADAINGRKAVRFTAASQQYLDFNNPDITSPTTIFVVAKVAAVNANPIVQSISSGTGRGAQLSSTTGRVVLTASGTPSAIASTKDHTDVYKILVFVYDAKTSRLYDHTKVPVNGELDINKTLNFQQSVRVGRGSGSSTTYSTMDLTALAYVNRAMSNSDVGSYMQSLATRYNLTLAAS